jgi:hypothetical protein
VPLVANIAGIAQSVRNRAHEPLIASRQCRSLEKHAVRERVWAEQAVRLGAALGKKPEDITLSRACSFRQRREKLDHIIKSKPVYERVPGDTYWQLSLRNANAYYIPVGNDFSGAQYFTPCHKLSQ